MFLQRYHFVFKVSCKHYLLRLVYEQALFTQTCLAASIIYSDLFTKEKMIYQLKLLALFLLISGSIRGTASASIQSTASNDRVEQYASRVIDFSSEWSPTRYVYKLYYSVYNYNTLLWMFWLQKNPYWQENIKISMCIYKCQQIQYMLYKNFSNF